VTTVARAVNGNFIVAQRLWTQADPILARRYGLANAVRRGVVCFSAASFPEPFGDLAIGFGVERPPTRAALNAVLAYYAGLGQVPRIAVLGRLAPQAVARQLRKAGLQEAAAHHHVFVRTGQVVPRSPLEAGIVLEPVRPERIELNGHGEPATVADVVFVGAFRRVLVDTDGGDTLVDHTNGLNAVNEYVDLDMALTTNGGVSSGAPGYDSCSTYRTLLSI